MEDDQIRFADRMQKLNGSAIREIFKYMGRPRLISFAGGNPAAFALPDQQIAEISRRLLLDAGKQLLQYGPTEGYLPLREALPEYIRKSFDAKSVTQNILITTGSMQGLDLLLRTLVNPGEAVLTENPSFLGALQAMTAAQASIKPVASDDEGLDVGHLEELMRKHHPKLLYTIPTFQNPTGRTLSLERRKRVAELAAQYRVIVAEDDPYHELRYEGMPLPSIKSFDEHGYVVLLGSFSKTISPGLRVGFMAGREDLIAKCGICKQCTDVHTPNLNQAIVHHYLSRGLIEGHVASILPQYSAMMRMMLNKLQQIPEIAEYTKPEGGLFIFARLKDGLQAVPLFKMAIDKGLAFVPGEYFYAEGGHRDTLRLNFSGTDLEGIGLGMEILKNCLTDSH